MKIFTIYVIYASDLCMSYAIENTDYLIIDCLVKP